MLREQCRLNMQVSFGRENGEKTLGVVVKMNPKKAKVKILEDRGSRSQVGAIWMVPYSMMEPATGEVPAAPVREPLKYSPFADPASNLILQAIECVYANLSPENLSADGERPFSQVASLRRRYNGMLKGLFAALGREVTEMEVYEWTKSREEYERTHSFARN